MNIVKSEDLRKRGRSSIKNDNKRARILRRETKAWQSKKRAVDIAGADIQQDDKIVENQR